MIIIGNIKKCKKIDKYLVKEKEKVKVNISKFTVLYFLDNIEK